MTSAFGQPRPGLAGDDPDSVARRVFVGGLPTELVDNDTLMALFAAEFGPVEDAIIMKHHVEGHDSSRGFGFVLFCDKRSADDAIKAHWVPFQHRRVEVKAAVPRGGVTAPRPTAEAPAPLWPYAPAGSAHASVDPPLRATGPTRIMLDAFLADNSVEPSKDKGGKDFLEQEVVAPSKAAWGKADHEEGTKGSIVNKPGVVAVSSKDKGPNGPSAAKPGAIGADRASVAPAGPISVTKRPGASSQLVEPAAWPKPDAIQTAPAATSAPQAHGGPARPYKDGTPTDAARPAIPSAPLSKNESKQATSKSVIEPVPSIPPPYPPSGATATSAAPVAPDLGVSSTSNHATGVPVPKPLPPGEGPENVDGLAHQMQSLNVKQPGWGGGGAASLAPAGTGDTITGKSVLAPQGPLLAPPPVSAPPGHGWANPLPPYPQQTLNTQPSNLAPPNPAPYAGSAPSQLQAHTPDASPQRPAPGRYYPAEGGGYAPAMQSPPPAFPAEGRGYAPAVQPPSPAAYAPAVQSPLPPSYARSYRQQESMGPPVHPGYYAPQPMLHQPSAGGDAHPAYPQVGGPHSSPSPAPLTHASPRAAAAAEGTRAPGFNPSTRPGQAGMHGSAAGGQGIPYNIYGVPSGNGSGSSGVPPQAHPGYHGEWGNAQQPPQPPQPPSFPSYSFMHNGGHQQTGVAARTAPQYQYGHGLAAATGSGGGDSAAVGGGTGQQYQYGPAPAAAASWGAAAPHGQAQAAPLAPPQRGQGFGPSGYGAGGYGQQAAPPAGPEDDDLDELVAMLG